MGKVIIFILMLFSLITNVVAKDLGKIGQTFKIKEEPFIEMMKRKLEGIDMEKEQEKMQKLARDRVENPVPVFGISGATEDRTFYFDPTYTLDQDAVLPCGKILHRAGTKVNPLEYMDLNRRIFFVDGREERQVQWLKEQLSNHLPEQQAPLEDRVILVGGSPFKIKEELSKTREREVYFDQSGELASKFAIKHSPAIATQEGLKIRIDEIKLNNR